MPIYEYRCLSCGQVTEAVVLPGESEPIHCPDCGGALIRKIPSSVGIAFKGAGFFVTDNPRTRGNPSDHEPSEESPSATRGSGYPHSPRKTGLD